MVIITTHFDYLLSPVNIHKLQWVVCYVRISVGHLVVYIHETQWVVILAIHEIQWIVR